MKGGMSVKGRMRVRGGMSVRGRMSVKGGMRVKGGMSMKGGMRVKGVSGSESLHIGQLLISTHIVRTHYDDLCSALGTTLTCPALKKIFVFPKQNFVSS